MTSPIYISDMFNAFQGTGHLTGTRQFFVRFAGCSVKCPIRKDCDEPKALTRRGSRTYDAYDIVNHALQAVGPRGWLHITGGEPTDQKEGLQELVMHARESGLYVHVQTSGVSRLPVQWDWVTVSPKVYEPEQKFGQEMVVIVDGTVTLEWLEELRSTTSFWSYYLCPLWGRDMKLTSELAWKAKWDLTWQMHKHGGLR
jgi:organic radical activating enzyme